MRETAGTPNRYDGHPPRSPAPHRHLPRPTPPTTTTTTHGSRLRNATVPTPAASEPRSPPEPEHPPDHCQPQRHPRPGCTPGGGGRRSPTFDTTLTDARRQKPSALVAEHRPAGPDRRQATPNRTDSLEAAEQSAPCLAGGVVLATPLTEEPARSPGLVELGMLMMWIPFSWWAQGSAG